MSKEKSFNQHTVKIGTNDSRMRWGRHRLGMIETDDTKLVADHGPSKEALPLVELTLPTYFAGKIFLNHGGATDHVGHPDILSYYNRNIILSRWAGDHVYDNPPMPINIVPSPFNKVGYKIFGVQGNSKNINIFNLEWRTEGDWNFERGRKTDTSRCFPSTEVKLIKNSEAIDLLASGYDIYSKIEGVRNLNWIDGEKLETQGRNTNAEHIKSSAVETVTLTNQVESLWDNKQWLQDDSLVASLANTYLAIDNGKFVLMPKSVDIGIKEAVLIAQALSQMFAAKKNRLIGFVTDRGILGYSESKAHQLTFTDEKRPSYLQSDDIVIDPLKSNITDRNAKLVDVIRKLFVLPINEALDAWKVISTI